MDLPVIWAFAFGSSFVMAWVGWFVQIRQYPRLAALPSEHFIDAHRRHSVRIGVIVIPAMLAELASSVGLFSLQPTFWPNYVGAGLAIFAVGWTFAVSAPIHQRLSKHHDPSDLHRLIKTNLPRTLAWTAHALLCLLNLLSFSPQPSSWLRHITGW